MSVDVEKFVRDFYAQKAKEEEQKRLKEQQAEAILDQVCEENSARAFLLDFKNKQEFFQACSSDTGKGILAIALAFNISWQEAEKVYIRNQEIRENIGEKTNAALRKSVRPGADGPWTLSRADERRIKEVTPKLKNRRKNHMSKKELSESPMWQLALEAQRRGVSVDFLVKEAEGVINTYPAEPADTEVNPFDENLNFSK